MSSIGKRKRYDCTRGKPTIKDTDAITGQVVRVTGS
jgi:hypothetical protein